MTYVIRKEPKKKKKKVYDSLWLEPNSELAKDWAFVYISTETGKCQGVYYVMTTEEARRFCCHKKTAGVGQRGTHWAYFYTSVFNLIEMAGIEQVRFTHDTGKMDKVLKELDIEPLKRNEITELLYDKIGYGYPKGLMPGVIQEDGRAAVHEGWVSYNNNFGDTLYRRGITITFDNKYRK